MAGPGRAGPPALPHLLLGGLSGLLYALSIPSVEARLLAWVCLVPPLVLLGRAAARGRPLSPGRAAGVGVAFGVTSGLGRVYWIAGTLDLYGGLSPPVAVVTNGLLVVYLALYPALFLALAGRLPARSAAYPWLAASAWVLLEWVQTWMISGFPWELLGYSQYRDLALIQVASLTGVYGVSFLLVLANAAAAQALVLGRSGGRRLAVGLLPAVAVVAASYAYGAVRLAGLRTEVAPALRVGIVQGNIAQDEKWKSHQRTAAATRHYAALTRDLVAAAPDLDLVLFPETALPYYFRDPLFEPYAGQIRALARQLGRPLLVGSLEGDAGDREAPVYNRAFMLDGNGQMQGFADKVHLVPFGEYLPFPWLFQYMEGLTAESGRFEPGEELRAVALPGTDHRLGVFICYESIFPAITRRLVRLGADVLVNTTNDAWFGRTAAPHQHLSMAALRAVETGRAVVRAANTGISGAIAPTGQILSATGLFETRTLVVEVPARTEVTAYVAHGDLFLALCALLSAGWLGHQARCRRRGRPEGGFRAPPESERGPTPPQG